MSKKYKYSVKMDERTINDIKALDENGASVAEPIKKALRLLKYLKKMTEEGYDLILEPRDQNEDKERIKIVW